jgi:predicted Holliday junction resolvase-like endonuclease
MIIYFFIAVFIFFAFINFLIFFLELRDFKRKIEKFGVEGALELLKDEETWEKVNKQVLASIYYPGLRFARWINKRLIEKKLKAIEERKVYLRKLAEKV